MFVIIYQPSDEKVEVRREGNETFLVGQWKVDTCPNGQLITEDDLEIALERVKHIREKGGEACLAVVIE